MNPGAVPPPVPVVAYYVAANGQAIGPFELATLQQMVIAGQLNAASLVWKAGMTEWVKAGEVEDIKSLLANVMPPIPPQN